MSTTDRTLPQLLGGLSAVTLVLFANYAGAVSVLLPAQVAAIDPAGKVGALAVVLTVSAAFTVVAQPVLGALSDRTHSAAGRRGPVMLGSAVVAAAALAGLGGAASIFMLAALWSVAQFVLNGVDVTSSAYLADRVAAPRRGLAAALFAAAAVAGGILGAVVGGVFLGRSQVGYAVLGVVLVVVVAAFVMFDRGASRPARAPRSSGSLRGFWLELRAVPAFAWVFAARMAFILGYQLVYGYLLYIGTDHLGLGEAAAAALVGALTVIGGTSLLVGAMLGGGLSDRLGRRVPFLVAGGIVLAVALVIPLVWPTAGGMVAFAAVQGVGSGFSIACGPALAAGVLPGGSAAHAARGVGLYNVATTVPQVFAPLLAAAIIPVAGYSALFLVACLAALLSSVLASRIRERF